MPPALLISSNVNNNTSRKDVSLMAIVPLSECRMPTLMVSAWVGAASATARLNARNGFFRKDSVFFISIVSSVDAVGFRFSSAYWFFAVTGRHARGLLTPAFQHSMCHEKI